MRYWSSLKDYFDLNFDDSEMMAVWHGWQGCYQVFGETGLFTSISWVLLRLSLGSRKRDFWHQFK